MQRSGAGHRLEGLAKPNEHGAKRFGSLRRVGDDVVGQLLDGRETRRGRKPR